MTSASRSRRAVTIAFAIGVAYFVIGWIFGQLAGSAVSAAGRTRWRLAAWVMSGIAFAAQITYERIRLRNASGATASRAALAAAVGGFLLAVAATVHKTSQGGLDARYLLALVVWPLAVAVPAFGAALVAAAIIRVGRRSDLRLPNGDCSARSRD